MVTHHRTGLARRFAQGSVGSALEARRTVNRYLDCGIFACGFARVRCGECGHDYFVAFSCKLRCICPSCHMKRELIWAEWARDELLEDVAHRQVVFTIPKRLRPCFRYGGVRAFHLFRCPADRAVVSGRGAAAADGQGLISQEVVDNLLSWRHSGFSVHADVKVADRQAAARLEDSNLLFHESPALYRVSGRDTR